MTATQPKPTREQVIADLAQRTLPGSQPNEFLVPSKTIPGRFYNVVVCPDSLELGRCCCKAGWSKTLCIHLRVGFFLAHEAPKREIEQLRRFAASLDGVGEGTRAAYTRRQADHFERLLLVGGAT